MQLNKYDSFQSFLNKYGLTKEEVDFEFEIQEAYHALPKEFQKKWSEDSKLDLWADYAFINDKKWLLHGQAGLETDSPIWAIQL